MKSMKKTFQKKRYYIIGIGGVAMGNLAGLLKQKGHIVAGSDQSAMYEPMKSMLKNLKIPVFTPYNTLHTKRWKPDVVVVGNAISRGNPELEGVISNGQAYRSVSDILREEFIEGKKAIVVAGTHGKTTTSALLAWILEYAGLDPTVFVGGFMRNFDSGFKYGKGEYVVLEGDEYDTSFFDKNPKIFGYRPLIGIVNNIELDHVDIYENIENLKKAFGRFSFLIPQNGLLVLNRENKLSFALAPQNSQGSKIWKNAKSPRISTFGIKVGDVSADKIKFSEAGLEFHLKQNKKDMGIISSHLSGKHNISNILSAMAVADFLKIPLSVTKDAVSSFSGVKRRLEVIAENNGKIVLDDYAHHPTAVHETLNAIKNKFHGPASGSGKKRIIALFEPGSASSKRRIFENQYFKAFKIPDVIYIYKPFHVEQMKKNEVFNGKHIVNRLRSVGKDAWYMNDVDKLLFHVKSHSKPGDVIIIMSCRGFDGLREKIIKEI